VKILAVSDVEVGFIYSPLVRERFQDVDLIISCGDLPYYYLEYLVTMLNVPLYYVRGNHSNKVEYSTDWSRSSPWGATDIHHRVVEDDTGLLIAGLEGCLQYNLGPQQYSQFQYWVKVITLVPRLLWNKLTLGRYLDIFITHAPPWKVHDADDRPHQGVKAFVWLIRTFKPEYHLHGHVHIYRRDQVKDAVIGSTRVVNTYGYKELSIAMPGKRSWQKGR
jgi:uncharacterized protein